MLDGSPSAGGSRLPALFLGHGTPLNVLTPNEHTESWSAAVAGLPTPRAILMVSAHWCTRGTAVNADPSPRTVHDFTGFPQAMFDVQYGAPGDPALAERVIDLLRPTPVVTDSTWGYDHGTWSVLKYAFPDADVPVVTLSLDLTAAPAAHWAMGARLALLREEGVLVVGSGNVVHNLAVMDRAAVGGPDWGERFEHHVTDALRRGDQDALVGFDRHPDATMAVPTPDHYLPLLYAAATAGPGGQVTTLTEGWYGACTSMLSLRFD